VDPQEPYRYDEPSGRWSQPYQPAPPRRRRPGWEVAAITVAVVAAVCGLVLVAAVVVFMVALNSWGNNK
jgi:hypothetical protein